MLLKLVLTILSVTWPVVESWMAHDLGVSQLAVDQQKRDLRLRLLVSDPAWPGKLLQQAENALKLAELRASDERRARESAERDRRQAEAKEAAAKKHDPPK